MMTPLTAFVLRHRRWIVGFWLLALVAGGVAAGKVPQRLSTDFSLPGQPVFATALGAGILLDATVVRALLVPATVALFGRWNWWLPGPLAKILPARPAEGSGS